MNLPRIQAELQKQKLDGWLFFDHHGRDPLAYRILSLGPAHHVTRRWYYLIPAHGEPRGLVHRIEPGKLDKLPGEKLKYAGWQEHTEALTRLLHNTKRVAMQYSPLCQIPYIALVDAGTVELVRSTGCEVVTSADLVQYFEATVTQEALNGHLEAGKRVDQVRAEAFQMIAERTANFTELTEFEVADFIRSRFGGLDLLTENCPTVAANANSGNPHYEPLAGSSARIHKGDFVLLDMWARMNREDSIYYDITWTGYCGTDIPEEIQRVFEVVRDGRDAAISRVRSGFESNEELQGFQVDDAARNYISGQGFGHRFIHRTGHSIGQEVHGNGANMDNFEVHDVRKVIPWTCFSIEPGIYLDDFGIRSEINMFITDKEAMVTGAIQRELVRAV